MKALLLTLTTCLFVLPAYAKYSGGTGKPNDPYRIATAADLIVLSETPEDYDKHFILTADIDLDPNLPGRKVFDKAVIAPDANDTTWDFEGTSFAGIFDGNRHAIANLTITGRSYVGLFGQLAPGAEIRNIDIVGVNAVGSGVRVGALVGWNLGTVNQCRSTGVVRGGWGVGGLAGNNGGTVRASYASANVTGDDAAGGLVGVNGRCSLEYLDWACRLTCESGTICECYSTGLVVGSNEIVGGLVGSNVGGTVVRSYASGNVKGSLPGGGLVAVNYQSWQLSYPCAGMEHREGDVVDSFWDTQTSGQMWSDGGIGKTTAEMRDPNMFMAAGWDFVGEPDGPHDIWARPEAGGYPVLWWQLSPLPKLPTFSGGTGEPNDPYRLSRPDELNSIGHNPRLMGAHFEMTNDIDLGGIEFCIIGSESYPFVGSFNGNGHAVSHLTITGGSYIPSYPFGPSFRGDTCIGFLGRLEGEVKDLGMVDVNVAGRDYRAGGLVGTNGSGGSVIRCYCSGAVSGNTCGGGLVGDNCGNITMSASSASVACSSGAGGLVGWNSGNVTHSYSAGRVTGSDDVGGLVGANSATVADCYSIGVVAGTGYYAGGLVGSNVYGYVIRCYSTGAVSGNEGVGGLVGENWLNEGTVTACFWDIQTSGQATSYGGTGKTIVEMQTAKTFLEAGWDFVGETVNGTEDIWWINEGKDYPKLWWEAQD